MTDVTIPGDKAESWARWVRAIAERADATTAGAVVVDPDRCRLLADLLDPKPPTLREQVVAVQREAWYSDTSTPEATADAVLTVVADWLAAQPLHAYADTIASCADQRAYNVRLLRGES